MEDKYYTFYELKEIFGWTQGRWISKEEQIRYAQSHKVNIREIENHRPAKFKILNNPSICFTQIEIQHKYNWNVSYNIANFIEYAKKKGVILKQLDFSKKPYYYEIVDDSIANLKWKVYPFDENLEVAKEGYVRNIKTKNLLSTKNCSGYLQVKSSKNKKYYLIHRMVLETYNMVENAKDLYVDHINGIRDDNRLENLRWVSHDENMIYKEKNWLIIQNNFNKLLQKVGYEKLNELLEKLLIDYEKDIDKF